jgi:hypothetical protein
MADHGPDRIRSAERFGGLGMPGGPLLGEATGFVFGVPGFQGCLLRQLQRLHRRRRPTMITLKPRRQYTLPVLDQHPPRRPTLVQRRVHTDDLPHRPLTRIGVGPIREADPQPVAKMMLQGGVVGLRRSNSRLEQHPSVDSQPAPVEGLNLVSYRHMGVQVRVTGSRVPVGEGGRHQPGDVDLTNPVPPLPGEQSVPFDEAECILHGGLVRLLDLRRDVRVGDRPQRRHRLDRGEGQVIAGNRLGARTRLLSDGGGDLAGIDRAAAMPLPEELPRHLGTDLRPQCRRDGLVRELAGGHPPRGNPLRHLDPEDADIAGVNLERCTQPGRFGNVFTGQVSGPELLQPLCGEGMQAGAEECPHLLPGDRIPSAETINAGQAGADPGSRSFSAFAVVGGQPDMALLGGIQRHDLPGQIVIPRPSAELVNTHRHNP